MGSTDEFEWLTTNQAAKYLKAKPRTVQLWARTGKLPAYALSGSKRHVWRFRRADLDSFLLAHLVIPSASPTVLLKKRRIV
jgi:excisionase family DNA binding protein